MANSRQVLRRRLETIAFTQAGFFTAAQALEAGYSYQAQKYHVDAGNWVRVDPELGHV
ncbi:MAG: type IV toxin-antitoxin system AbiEi family antitoxin domain-containing protein [Propionibacteriaceae bacterium]|nr:type IV toxin-antitoxin system AbiEi family antitoxin domain-containing protein [Propionibacteriaceae bacterium]